MTPIEQAKQIWDSATPEERRTHMTFRQRLDYLIQTGCVSISPYSFVMAHAEDFGEKRSWFIEMATGNRSAILHSIPFQLPFISFCRGCRGELKLHIWPTGQFFRNAMRYIKGGVN